MPKNYNDYNFLLQRLQSGDLDAFEYLYVSSRNRLYALANSIIEDEESARDLVQQFFVDFLQSGQFQNVTIALKTYLFNSIRNRALRFIRDKASRAKKQDILERSLQFFDPQESISEIEQHLDQEDLSAEIENTVSRLPPMARKVFIMHYIQRMSHSKIAERLNISRHTVSNHIDRALRQLRAELKKNL